MTHAFFEKLDVDDDVLSVGLEHVNDDVSLVDLMRTCRQFAKCVCLELTARHGLEREQLVA